MKSKENFLHKKIKRVTAVSIILVCCAAVIPCQWAYSSYLENQEHEYWLSEIAQAKTERMPIARFIEHMRGHHRGKWRLFRGKMCTNVPMQPKHLVSNSNIAVSLQLDCQSRIVGGVAEIQTENL